MNQPNSPNAEKLVQVHQARDEWEGTLLIGYLRDNGLEATQRVPSRMPPFDSAERLTGSDKVCGIFVLEHDAEHATQLVNEFLTAVTDETVLAETAATKLRVDQATIHRLRGELLEERKTFNFLGWLVVVFLGSTALLWAIWPAWLKTPAPEPAFRWIFVVGLMLAALFVGQWASNRLK